MKLAQTITLGDKIVLFRQAKGWSQAELAGKAGLSNATLSSYEGGRRRPTIDIVEKIAEALGISVSDFYNDDIWKAFQNAFRGVQSVLEAGSKKGLSKSDPHEILMNRRRGDTPEISDKPTLSLGDDGYKPNIYYPQLVTQFTQSQGLPSLESSDSRATVGAGSR